MGMFDYVNVSIKCPKCNHIVQGFQTKDGKSNMNILEVEEVNHFYANCLFCGDSIEFTRKEPIQRLMNLEDLKRNFNVVIK